MDKLKEYLLSHQAELDVDPPANDSWENIASKLRPGPGFSRRVIGYAAAACVIALAGAGLWMVMQGKKGSADIAKHVTGEAEKGGANGVAHGPKAEVGQGPAKGVAEEAAGAVAQGPAKVGQGPAKGGAEEAGGRRHKARARRRPAERPDEIEAIDKSYSSLIDYQLKKLRGTPLYAEDGHYFSFYTEQFKQMDRDEQQVRNDIKTYGLTGEFLEQLINVYQQKLNVLKNLQTEINKMNNKVREKQSPSGKAEVHYLNI